MLKADNVKFRTVQEFRCLNIIADRFVVYLELYGLRIIIGSIPVRHGNNAGFKIRTSCQDCSMKIVGKCSNSAAARKIIPDEGHALNLIQLDVSTRLFFAGAVSRLIEVGDFAVVVAFDAGP